MNTAHNKDLIIDDGLLNTLRNGFGFPFDLGRVVCLPLQKNENGKCVGSITSKNNPLNDKQKHNPRIHSDVYTLPRIKSAPIPNENYRVQMKSLSVLECIPSSSSCPTVKVHMPTNLHPNVASTTGSEDEDEYCQTSSRLSTSLGILSHMKKFVKNEEAYLHYFKQLVQLEDMWQTKSTSNYEILPHIKNIAEPKTDKVTRSKGKSKSKSILENKGPKHPHPLQPTNNQMMVPETNLNTNISYRTSMRILALENCHVYCNDDESYNSYLIKLIDMEESFIESLDIN